MKKGEKTDNDEVKWLKNIFCLQSAYVILFLQRLYCITGIAIFLALGTVEGATQVSCITSTVELDWYNKTQTVTTCDVDVDEVDDENFTVFSASNLMTSVFNIRHKEGVKFLPTNLFHALPDLESIHIYNCSVTTINENHFKSLTKLKLLTLSHNRIEHIASEAFDDLVSLKTLALGFNGIRTLEENTFASLKSMTTLYLYNNEIQVLHPNIFSSLAKVKDISLYGNNISSLDENIFSNLASLKSIELGINELEVVPKNLFKNNLKLQKIFIDQNKINFIDASMFDHLQKLKTVDMKGNPCIDSAYNKDSFVAMRNDLMERCNGTSQG